MATLATGQESSIGSGEDLGDVPVPEATASEPGSTNGESLHTSEATPVYRELEEERKGGRAQSLLYRFFPQPIRNSLKPPMSRSDWKRFLYIHLPIVHWVWYYTPKYLIGDIVAGLTIGVTQIPHGIGFALLAFLPPSYGLYSSFIPVLLYSVFGTSKHLSVGTFPIVALMTGGVVDSLTYSLCAGDGMATDNITDPCELNPCFTERVNVAVTLSLMVGIIFVVMSFLKLGVISLFLSDALISGYTAAAAFVIVVTQLAPLLGMRGADSTVDPGLFVTPRRLYKYLGNLFKWKVSVSAIVTSIICFIILIIFDFINRFLKKKITKISIYIPGQLVVVILATGISYAANLSDLPVINDAGGILPAQCYTPKLPVGRLIGDVISEAFVIAVISFVINISQAKLMAQKNSYLIHPDQELFAYGVMNIGGSFFRSFPTAGALSRTVLQDLTGGKTQFVSIIASFLVLFVMLAIGFLFNPLPNAVVAVIVVMALKGLFLQLRDVRRYYYLHWPDMIVWLVVFAATLIIGLDIGLGIGILFSLFVIIVRTILPYSPSLGEANQWCYPLDPNSSEYDENQFKVKSIPGCYIYQFNAPLYFANCNVFRSRLFIELGINTQQDSVDSKGCFEQCYDKLRSRRNNDPLASATKFSPQRLEEDVELDYIEVVDEDSKGEVIDPPSEKLSLEELGHQTVIIDCGPIGFIDSMGVFTLEKVTAELHALNIQVLFAAPSTPICEALGRCRFFDRYSSVCLFPSVASAVMFVKKGCKVCKVDGARRVSKKLMSNFERILERSKRFGIVERFLTTSEKNNNDKEN